MGPFLILLWRSVVLSQTLPLLWRHHRSWGCLKSKGRCESAASTNLSTWSCSTVLSEPGLPEFEDLIRECAGSPDLNDLSGMLLFHLVGAAGGNDDFRAELPKM
ncbi:hypothetical protein SRHO_G00180880 [Serrasalmus rhombeus]